MPSLREVKGRIASVESTKKITQARQMISSAQLHRAQSALNNAMGYYQAMQRFMLDLAKSEDTYSSPLTEEHSSGPIAVIIMSSNGGMIGSFNAKMAKELDGIKKKYPNETLLFYPIGKKIRDTLAREGYKVEGNFDNLLDKANFSDIAQVATMLIEQYKQAKLKKVELVYYRFKNVAVQDITHEIFLPFVVPAPASNEENTKYIDDYILEPSYDEIVEDLLPRLLKAKLYACIMDNRTSEHAARTMAMQLASENADNLLDELRLTYNKVRQQNITSELLDIIGSSFA
jgi:F-type H+-transporting ATPase subunit gamma